MSIFYEYVQNPIRKATRNLLRDYNEINLMQSGDYTKTLNFAKSSLKRTSELLVIELEKLNFNSIIFDKADFEEAIRLKNLNSGSSSYNVHLLVNPLDGIENFSRALPFFGVSITHLKYENGKFLEFSSVISIPSELNIIFAEKGKGAWSERFDDMGKNAITRLRSSKIKDIGQAITNKKLGYLKPNITKTRDFACSLYELCCFVSGKLDAIHISSEDYMTITAAKLFSQESGSSFIALESGDVILTNEPLSKYF
ncbi:MAG: hypothetical protein SFT93_06090 [Rickettsiaceae bacterium]|nr:hypothetical protein [Rickettsiaceae bacterium]